MTAVRLILILTLIGLAVLPVMMVRAQDDEPEPFPRTVIDGSGASVLIPERPQRVAVLGATFPLTALLSPGDILPVDPGTPGEALDWDGVGLLVVSEAGAALYADQVMSARAAGIPVFQVGPITSISDWRSTFATLGRAAGRDDRAQRVLARMDRCLWAVSRLAQRIEPVRVLVLTPEGYTFGQHTLITDLIALAGGINLTAQAGFDDYRQIDDATIRELAPDVILLTPAWSASEAASFAANPAYAAVPASKSGRIFRLPFSPTRVQNPATAAAALAVMLHLAIPFRP